MSLSAPLYVPAEEEEFVDSELMIREERSKAAPWLFAIPLFAATISALGGGIPFLTDFAFVLMTILCAIFLIAEFRAFSFRWGIGGMLVFGGTLVWFCMDYMRNWLGVSLSFGTQTSVPMETVARAAAFHILFVMMMAFGLRIRLGGKLENFLARFPQPADNTQYIVLFVGMFLIGMSPYFFFTREGVFQSFWNDFMGGRAGGALWTVGRTGNVNFNYGAYLAQVIQVGTMGSILAAFYAIIIARSWMGRLLGFVVWLPAAMLGFGSGTRGALVLVALPAIGFFFIRFQAQAAALGKRVSLRGYLLLGTFLLMLLALVQIQITFRGEGFRDANLSEVTDRHIEGNVMFSESLTGFFLVPKQLQPFYDRYAGEAIVLPIPEQIFWFFVTPIPRALWTGKPIDPVWQWYNNTVAGTTGVEGTTISNGGVGHWYFRYGWIGVIEGGLYTGYLMGMVERLLRQNFVRKPLTILISLGIATFLFRTYRGFVWLDFHSTLVGFVALAGLVKLLHIFMGGPRPDLDRAGLDRSAPDGPAFAA